MATSSIFETVRITDPKRAEEFIDALDASANEFAGKKSTDQIPTISDLDEIRKLMRKRFPDI